MTYIHIKLQAGRQTHSVPTIHTEKQADTYTNNTERQTNGPTGQKHIHTDGQTDRDRQTDR